MELGEETEKEMEEKVRVWMQAEKMDRTVCHLRGEEIVLEGIPWITPSQSSGSEPEMARTETGCSTD